MSIDLTQIILAIITFIFGIVAKYGIPWLIENTDEKKRAKIADIVQTGVEAADRWLKTATGEERKAYVVAYLKERGYTVNTEDVHSELNAMIESAVEKLRIAQKTQGMAEK